MTAVHRAATNVDRSQAERILRDVPPEKAFYFYTEIGEPTGLSAKSLREFGTVMAQVDPRSIEFHVLRGDFEKWLVMLGDQYLAHQIGRLRDLRFKGEPLRTRAVEMINTRAKALSQALGR